MYIHIYTYITSIYIHILHILHIFTFLQKLSHNAIWFGPEWWADPLFCRILMDPTLLPGLFFGAGGGVLKFRDTRGGEGEGGKREGRREEEEGKEPRGEGRRGHEARRLYGG